MQGTPTVIGRLIIGLFALSIWGCSTDIDINAPYREYTVMYALFDKNETTHLVKINKSFLGEGNALDMAQVPDSSEFTSDELQAVVNKYVNGSIVETYTLNDTTLTNRVPGTFYYPDQLMYTFNAVIDEDAEYEVLATINGDEYRARTSIVNDFNILQSTSNLNIKLNFYNPNSGNYSPDVVKWRSGVDGKRYEVYYRFKYREVIGTDTTDKSITRRVGREVANTLSGNQELNLVINGLEFYSGISNLIDDDPNVSARIFDYVDLLWEVANEDLHVYLQLNEPVTGIVEDRPPFTNVDNDGLGIVVSRTTKEVLNKRLRDESLLELVTGQYTGSLRFCSPDHVVAPLSCP